MKLSKKDKAILFDFLVGGIAIYAAFKYPKLTIPATEIVKRRQERLENRLGIKKEKNAEEDKSAN